MCPPVLEVPLVHVHPAAAAGDLLPPLAQRDQPMRFGVVERLEQDAVDNREHGGRGADGQGQSQNDGEGVAAVAPEAADRVAKVELQGAHVPLDGAACEVV
jgi:hypothetical protein